MKNNTYKPAKPKGLQYYLLLFCEICKSLHSE